VTTIGLAAVNVEETASAAGLMSFLRTMAAAIATSIATTSWNDDARVSRSEIVSSMNTTATETALHSAGFSIGQIRGTIEQFVDRESLALATDHIFLISASIFAVAAMLIWLAPRPTREIEAGAAH
jgi:DHA2 family multidrug resistance protein